MAVLGHGATLRMTGDAGAQCPALQSPGTIQQWGQQLGCKSGWNWDGLDKQGAAQSQPVSCLELRGHKQHKPSKSKRKNSQKR